MDDDSTDVSTKPEWAKRLMKMDRTELVRQPLCRKAPGWVSVSRRPCGVEFSRREPSSSTASFDGLHDTGSDFGCLPRPPASADARTRQENGAALLPGRRRSDIYTVRSPNAPAQQLPDSVLRSPSGLTSAPRRRATWRLMSLTRTIRFPRIPGDTVPLRISNESPSTTKIRLV
jgi:hypothetical protein